MVQQIELLQCVEENLAKGDLDGLKTTLLLSQIPA